MQHIVFHSRNEAGCTNLGLAFDGAPVQGVQYSAEEGLSLMGHVEGTRPEIEYAASQYRQHPWLRFQGSRHMVSPRCSNDATVVPFCKHHTHQTSTVPQLVYRSLHSSFIL
jgi:hypothetical protein